MPVYVGDVNTEVRLKATEGIPIQSPIVWRIEYEKPDGSTGYWDASVYVSGTDYYASAIVQNGDFDQSGLWKFQVYAELATGWKGHGDQVEEWLYTPI